MSTLALNSDIHYRGWTPGHRAALVLVTSFEGLAQIAVSIMSDLPPGLQMVSAPISTGKRSPTDNLKILKNIIEIQHANHVNVFSQLPFEGSIIQLVAQWRLRNGNTTRYCDDILTKFYGRIFASRLIHQLNFVDGWKDSVGARWEHENALCYGIRKSYLPPELTTIALCMP